MAEKKIMPPTGPDEDNTEEYDGGEFDQEASGSDDSIEIPDVPEDYDPSADDSELAPPDAPRVIDNSDAPRTIPGYGTYEQPVESYENSAPTNPPGKLKVFFQLFWYYKFKTIPALIVVILLILLAVPATRYPIVGTFLRRQFEVTVVDSKTNRPVSGAEVSIGDKKAKTDLDGRASLSVRVGKKTLAIDKKYYKGSSELAFVGINTQKQPQRVALEATGRQVPLKVTDKVSGKPVADVQINVLDTSGRTDKDGKTIIVLPTDKSTQKAKLSAKNYNNVEYTIKITDQMVDDNSLKITPSGKVYFLSNASGSIDVVSTDMDGKNRKTVVQATGNEAANTQLFVAPSLKYLALFSRRDASKESKFYLVDTSNNHVKLMDGSLSEFTPVGWAGDRFIYTDTRLDLQPWQVGHQELKSYSPADGNTTVLDKSAGEGTGMNDVIAETIDAVTLTDNQVLYAKDWFAGYQVEGGLDNRQNTIYKVQPNGEGRQNLRNIALTPGALSSLTAATVAKPQRIYLQSTSQATTVYYLYQNNTVTQSNTVTDNDFNKPYPKYYLSPSGTKNFWVETRDGKSVFLAGDDNAGDAKKIASLEGYDSFGWYTNDYVLISRDNQLFIIPSAGLDKDQAPLKVSDYYTPNKQ